MEADERDQAPPFAGAGARPRRPGDRTRRADFRTRQVSRRQETRREEQTLNGQEAASENKWPSPLRDATHNEPDHDKHIYTTSNSETGDRSSRPTGQTVNSTAQSEAGAKTRRRRCFRSGGHQDGRGGGPRADCPRLLYSPHHRLRLVVMAALLGCLLAAALAGQRARGYQLANNLIANNLPPRFVQSGGSGAASTTTNSEIVVRVKEGPASIGKLIYTLKGEDPDEDPLTFGVLGTMASDLLRVENVPGNQANVYLRKELDRETTESHQVVITLTDGKLGRGNWVEDVNDNYPVFGPHRTAISIREDARAPLVIETIEATDADEGRFGQVIYKLDESAAAAAEQPGGDPSGRGASAPSIAQMFQIDTVDGKGVISLIGQLDFEQRPLYQLRVLAIDRAQENERLSTSTSILVSVEDCEDQPPMFTFAPSITRIPEDLPAGSAVVRVSAIDGDRGVNNPIKYSLVSVNNQETGFERNLFSIGSDSGQISVAHELDRELTMEPARAGTSGASSNQPGAYVLQVRATELGQSSGLLEGLFASGSSAANSVTTELTVILIDVNDELPTFNRDKFFGELLENSPAESLVSFVQGRGEFAQQPSPGQAQQLVGAKVFDRDQGTNGTFTLHLEGEHGHLFEVWPSEATNEATLMIKVAASAASASNAKFFDYETNKELRLTLVAREKFPPPGGAERRQSSAEMLVQLRDTNDNYPQFDTDLYRVEIPENAIRGMHICAVKAADLDSGALGSAGVRYTEIRGERANKFKLDPVTGVITLRTNEHGFDREQTAQHHLIVEARDNLGLGNRNTTQLMIVLTDVNDQRPKFLLDQYEAFIYENELDFQSPLQVQASDLDAPNTQNSRLTYSIVGGDAQRNFTIDPTTGRIRVRTTLVASQPAGARHASFDLDQAQSAGALTLGELEGANVVQATGLDFERIPQKRDETRQFNLTIRASDGGLPEPLSSTTQVVVVVYDKNDHAPVFSRPVYARSIREDAPGGSAVIQVQAQDGDHSPANSKITYRISSGASDKFVIDSDSGLISVANGANLDIDRVQGGGQRRTGYLLNVLASDGSFGQNQKSASALVNVTIIDVNNKAPEFVSSSTGGQQGAAAGPANQQQQQPVVFVNEDAPYGLIVTRVFATDLDSSAELRFSINYARSEARNEDMILVEPGVYRDVFAIDPLDGTIKVNKQLDRELFDQVKLRLQVEDLAAQTADQVAHSHLLVRITDVNDNRPAFKRPVYKAVVNENSISGTSVTTMAADDRDLNKTLRYSLEASSPELARLVRINPRSGEVTVNDKIDRELFPLINVTVKAEDLGQPHSLTGSAQLIITVRDENDNNPIFLNSTHLRPSQARHSDPSSAAANQTGPNNHNMHYRSSSLAGPSSYRLRSLGPHSAGAPSGRFLSEQGQPPVLELTDGFNQHYPETSYFGLAAAPSDENGRELALLAPGSSAQVREDAAVGHQIAYVRAEDADVGNNGRVTYLLDPNSNADGKFRIERDSGILSVAQPLDREHQKQYALIIEACDNFDLGYSTGESRRAFTQVNVQVTDVNDNAPTISTNLQASPSAGLPAAPSSGASASFPTYDDAMSSPGPYELPLADCLAINEFQPTNEPILVITASDPDDPETPNGQMDMAIINNQHQNELFALVPVRGGPQTSSPHSLAGSEPVTITPAAGRPSVSLAHLPPPPLPPSSTPSSDLSGFDGAEARRAKRSVASMPEPRFAPSPVHRSRLAPTTTDTPPPQSTSPIPTTQMTRLALTSAPSGQQTGSGELQMHLVVSQSLKEKVGNYSILVRASDRASPSLSSVRLINVCVQDVNNHAPVFTRPPLNHTIRIMENATVGSFVTQVEASDADHGLNGELQYALKPTNIQNNNNDWQSFKIDRLSGAITTTKPFNRQQKKYYTLRVQAQDFGRPTSLSSDIDINIMIVNAGKYQPEFELQHQSLQFTENVAPNVEWFKLLQTTNLEDDPALIHMNQLEGKPAPPTQNWISSPCYYIVDGDDYDQVFHLDRYSHKLTNQKELDRERRSNYTLVVQASNNCNARPPPRPMTRALEGDETSAATTTRSSLMTAEESARSGGERFKRQLFAPKMGPVKRRDEPASEKLTAQGGAELGPAAQQAVDALVASDKSLLKVTIKIKDVNDNAPKFTQRIYTGGITTEADFGTVFMIVQAIDADSDANGQVTYSIVKPIKRNLSLMQGGNGLAGSGSNHQMGSPVDRQRRSTTAGADERATGQTSRYQQASPHDPTAPTDEEPHPGASSTANPNLAVDANGGPNELGPQLADGDDLFVVSAQTGEISLNFDPQKQMKGYFEFEILAKDADGLSDSARVLIYLLRQDQRVKFVLRLTPQELRKRLNRFRSVFGNITGALVNIDSYKYFENHDGTVDKKKTSLYLHFVQPEDNTIIEVDKVLTLIDNNIEYLDELYKEFHVLSSEAAHLPLSSGALVDPIDQVRTSLMGISSFLALILVLVIALCLNQRTRYERQLKAAAVSAFGGPPLHLDPDFHSTTNLPNTNLHSQDPNPIWMNGHHYNSPTSANRMQDGPGGRGDDDGRGHWISNISGADCAKSTPGGNLKGQALSGRPAKASAQAARGKQQSLFHSASSGVGMTLDDDEELEELSTSGGEQSDMNSLTNVVAQHHHHHHYGGGGSGAPTAATVTPRDSLDSSHGQVSSGSSSGANSTSTTNERQVLCSGNSKRPQQPPQPRPARGEPKEIRPARTAATNAGPSATTTLQSGASNSTFGAFKEVTIYTERPSKRPEVEQKQASQQSQASRLVSQFNSSRLQQINQQQQQQRQSIYVGAEANPPQPHKAHHPQQQQKSRVAVHANGAGAEQGAIKSAGHQAATKFDKLDAKFVPANDGASQPSRLANGSQQQDQSDNNFETSLSKLSILNLETTEL